MQHTSFLNHDYLIGEKLMSEKLSFKWENGKMRVNKFECENQKEEV